MARHKDIVAFLRCMTVLISIFLHFQHVKSNENSTETTFPTCIRSAKELQFMFMNKTKPDSDKYLKWLRPTGNKTQVLFF